MTDKKGGDDIIKTLHLPTGRTVEIQDVVEKDYTEMVMCEKCNRLFVTEQHFGLIVWLTPYCPKCYPRHNRIR